jgi:hypothetical protein
MLGLLAEDEVGAGVVVEDEVEVQQRLHVFL